MFYINQATGDIQLTRGNSCEIQTQPFLDENPNTVDDDTPIILGEADKVLFCVKSVNGRTKIKKIITSADYNDNGVLTMKLTPLDTMLEPYRYRYSMTYCPDNGTDAYTYIEAAFEIMPATGTIDDLGEEFQNGC